MSDKNNNHNAIIFAAYSKDGKIYNDIPEYLAELKRHTDFLIYVSDNDTLQEESLDIINQYADYMVISKHNKYDFGSYQIGFNYLINQKKNLYNKLNRIFFCNDSVIYCGNPLDEFFDKSKNTNFYGLTCNAYGFSREENNGIINYPWSKLPHIQSYLFSVSKEIADNVVFRYFMNHIEIEDCKNDVIAKYEIGLSKLILETLNYKMETFYPKIADRRDPCGYFLSQYSSYKEPRLFLKRKPVAPVKLEQDVELVG